MANANETKATTHTYTHTYRQTHAKRLGANSTDTAPKSMLAVSDHKSCFAMLMRPVVVVAVAFLLRKFIALGP